MTAYTTLMYVFGAFVLFGSFVGFFGTIQPEGYFITDISTENVSFSYPPWESQSEEFINLNESDGVLELNNSETGVYSSVLEGSGNLSVEWNSLNYESSQAQGTLEVVFSDKKDFSNVVRTETFELRNGVRVLDLEDTNSNYMKFIINLEGGSMETLTIDAVDQVEYNDYSTWILVAVVLMLLVLFVVFFMGIVMSGF